MTNTSDQTKDAAVAVARDHARPTSDPVTLSTGIRARLKAVSTHLIDDATRRIKYPKVPLVLDEDKGREIENPFDPDYLAEREEADRKKGMAAMDIMTMFGVELADGVPPTDEWLPKLVFMAKQGIIDFDVKDYDLTNPMEVEYLFKRNFAVSAADISRIGELSGVGGVNAEETRRAEESFRGDGA